MRVQSLLYLLVSSVLLLGSCRQAKLTVFFCDPVSLEIHSRRGLGEQALERIAAEQGRRLLIRRTLPGAQAESELAALLQEREVERVLITPLFTFDIALTADRFPDILFIREEYSPPGELTATASASAGVSSRRNNLVRIVYDRDAAFEKAGEAAAVLAAGLGAQNPQDSGGVRAGILTVPLSERGKREIEAFRAGFAARAEESLLVERQVNPASDRVRARQALEEMRQNGVELILFKTYGLTGFCLEELKKSGGLAIIEDYQGGGGYDEVVILSIEDDLAAAYAASLGADVSPPALPGKTYLRWGGLKALPEPALKEELSFVRE